MTHTPTPVTLGDLARDGKLLWVYCRDCGRERDLQPAALPLPPAVTVPSAWRHFRCSACGGKAITTRPELYPGGIEAARARRQALAGPG